MRSEIDCIVLAAHCEHMAYNARYGHNRTALLETARIWRRLAMARRPREPIVGPPYLPSIAIAKAGARGKR